MKLSVTNAESEDFCECTHKNGHERFEPIVCLYCRGREAVSKAESEIEATV